MTDRHSRSGSGLEGRTTPSRPEEYPTSIDDDKCSLAQLVRALEVLDRKLKELALDAPLKLRAP